MDKNDSTYKILLEMRGLMGEHTAKLEGIGKYIEQHDKDIGELKDFRSGLKAKVGIFATLFAFVTTAATQVAIKLFISNK